jgi:hypothetical protein
MVDMLVPTGVGAGVGLETMVSPFVCTEDAVTRGGEPVFRVRRTRIRKETCGISMPLEAHNDRGTYIGITEMLDQRLNIYERAWLEVVWLHHHPLYYSSAVECMPSPLGHVTAQ